MAIYISASMIDDFISCNKMVYYRINKSEVALQSRSMVVGEVVHSAIETFWNDEGKAIDFSIKQINERLPNDNQSVAKAVKCTENFFSNFRIHLSDDDEIEKKFRIQYDKDVYIVGRMDRVSRQSVFDWKTSERPKLDVSKDVQFIIYDWAYKQLYNKTASVYYASLSTGNLVRYSKNDIAHKVLFEDIIPQLITAIKAKDFTPNGVFRRACFNCQYSESCLKEIFEQ